MSDTWFYVHNRATRPISAAELRSLVDTGQVRPSEFVRKEGEPGWVRASTALANLQVDALRPGPILLGPSSLARSKNPLRRLYDLLRNAS
jgi:hypothetical protein